MGIDYYAILNVCHDASAIEIKLAYRKWAIICHPDFKKNPCDIRNPPEASSDDRPCPGIGNECYWQLLNEAYDVLTNMFYRNIYDVHGEEGLKGGVATKHGYFAGYSFHGDCRKTYTDVFGTYSPYADIIDAVTNPPPLARIADGVVCPKKKDSDIERLLYVDLKEVFYGGTKKMKILRHEFVHDMKMETKIRDTHLVIPIKPGILPGTKIRFPEAGDQGVTTIPADIVFIVCDKKHDYFTRKGANLHVTQFITLKDALCGLKTSITTIDGRKITFTINDVINADYCHTIEGEGLPCPNDNKRRGNICIHFNVEYPKYIPRNIKAQLNNLLAELENENLMDQMEKMNNITKLILRQKIVKDNEKINGETRV